MNTHTSLQPLQIALCWVFGVLVLGIVGYMYIEHLSLVDAVYTTIGMMTTVGNLVRPLSKNGRIFTIAVIILGVGSLFYTFGASMEYMLEGHLSKDIGRRLMDRKIAALRNHFVICGYGRVGSRIAADLAAIDRPFVVLDDNEAAVQRCIARGHLVLQGDAGRDDLLHQAGIQHAKGLLVATEQDAHNIFITLSARHLNPDLFIVARANHDETEAKLKLAGADHVLSLYIIGGHHMANLMLQPTVVEFFDTLFHAEHAGLAVQEMPLTSESSLIGKSIVAAQNMLTDGTMILAIKKPGGVVSASRLETCIESGDAVIAVGTSEQLVNFATKHGLWGKRI